VNQPTTKAVMPIIVVPSVEEVQSFYVDTLGFDHVRGVVGKNGQFEFCTVAKGGARIMFVRTPGREPQRQASRREAAHWNIP